MSEIHKEIIQKIIDKEEELIGKVAVMQAKKLDFINIDDDRNIEFKGNIDRKELEQVINIYKKVVRGGAVAAAREALKEYEPSELQSVDLPEEILPKEVKIQKFTSSF